MRLLGPGGAKAQPAPDILTRIPVLNRVLNAPMPPPIGKLLHRIGIEPPGETLLSSLHPGYRTPPAVDPKAVALMQTAQTADVIADGDNLLFDPRNVELGLWHSSYFLDAYGTALFLAAPYDDDRIPVVLVHGINGSPRDFQPLVSRLADSPYQPVLFFYPSGMALGDAARQLSAQLQAFVRRHHVDRFAVVGHSMGGLVAKGMLDQVDVAKALPGWNVLISISSPWRGIDLAAYSDQVPRHPPSWDDLPPESTFLRKVNSTPFPPNLAFYVFFGARSGSSLFAPGNNDGVLSLESTADAPVNKLARDVFGFYEDHNSILAAPLVHQRLESVLATELPPDVARHSG